MKKCSFILALCGLLLIGCSEQRKREAAKLEQELLAGQSQSTDSTAADSTRTEPAAVPDSTFASAVPDSSTSEPSTASDDSTSVLSDTSVNLAVSDSGIIASGGEQSASTEPAPDVNAIPIENGSAPVSGMPPHSAGETWTVQIASSTSKAYADSIVALFSSRGYQPYVGVVSVSDRDVYRVRVGHFATSRQATELKNKLAADYGLQPWIDKVSE